MTIKGIDVSNYQSSTFSTAGFSFVFVKATEGTSYINPKQAAQTAHARSAGMLLGFYHFLVPGNMKAQAAYFVAKCASVEGDTLWADWENPGVSCADKDAFLKEVKRLRPTHKVGLYCNSSYWKSRDTTSYAGDALWIAEYNGHPGKPSITAKWLFHQYTSTPLDTSVSTFASASAMRAWATGTPAAPAKPAAPKPPAKPVVDLSNVVAAAKADPKAAQGHTTHAADVKIVEAALKAEGLLSSKYASDGSYGTTTKTAYSAYQRKLGYSGADADGIPGMTSLKKLGTAHGFTVKA